MKKSSVLALLMIFLTINSSFALNTVFDSSENATEIKLAPTIKTNNEATVNATTVSSTNNAGASTSLKEQKFNNAIVNLDDAQVELRQELAAVTSKYNDAVVEKERAIQNCRSLKKEINSINRKMKNVDKSKKMINKNLEADD